MNDKTDELVEHVAELIMHGTGQNPEQGDYYTSERIITVCAKHYRDKAHARFMKCKGEVRRVGVQIVEDVFDE